MGKLANINAARRTEEAIVLGEKRFRVEIIRFKAGTTDVENVIFENAKPPGMAPWGDYIFDEPDKNKQTFIPKALILELVLVENKVQLL